MLADLGRAWESKHVCAVGGRIMDALQKVPLPAKHLRSATTNMAHTLIPLHCLPQSAAATDTDRPIQVLAAWQRFKLDAVPTHHQ